MELNDFNDYNSEDQYAGKIIGYLRNYVLDGISVEDIYNWEEGIPDEMGRNFIAHDIDQETKEILKVFGLGRYIKYATTTEIYETRMELLNTIDLQSHRLVVLILLVLGSWGIPYEEKTINRAKEDKERAKKAKEDLRQFSSLLELVERFRIENSVRDDFYSYGDTDKQIQYLLNKVIFEFHDRTNPKKEDKISIIQPRSRLNLVAKILLKYFELAKKYSIDVHEDLGIEYRNESWFIKNENNPHFLFCYYFISFLENYTNLNVLNLRSQNQQFRIYDELLRKAGYRVNTDPSVFYNIEANIRKYYKRGLELYNQLK